MQTILFFLSIICAFLVHEYVGAKSKKLLLNDPDVLRQELENLKQIVQSQQRKITELENNKDGGAVYVRWGRKECQNNDTELVYSGFMGGSSYLDTGAASMYACLPTDPQWGQHSDSLQSHGGRMYGSEYHDSFFKQSLSGRNDDAPCSVCRSSVATSVVMIPGRQQCYHGWKTEYSGYLASGAMDHKAATDYICLDGSPDILFHSQAGQNGALLYSVKAVCGSLACPPYVNGGELTCVVCSK